MEKAQGKRRLVDLLFSELAVFVTPVVGGLALYLVANVSWKFFPAIFVSLVPFGLGCIGMNRLSEWGKGNN